jgi:cytochrome c peroxidase
MMTNQSRGALLLLLAFAPVGCSVSGDTGADSLPMRAHPSFAPLPTTVPVNEDLAALGRRLYEDPRLSGDGTVACATCHVVAEGGDDGRRTSTGIAGQVGPINAPTVLNAFLNLAQFWDGRAATLEAQALGPVANPAEMGGDWRVVEAFLAADPDYVAAFEQLFGGHISADNATAAIAEYERTLVTPDGPFDRFLRGDAGAIGAQAQRGAERFAALGCTDCHYGAALGGARFARFGLAHDYFADRGGLTQADHGRYNVTGAEADRHVFKVPTLRNVALTAPYFHDGSVDTLAEAVEKMAYYQLGVVLGGEETADLVAFLETLTGDLPE